MKHFPTVDAGLDDTQSLEVLRGSMGSSCTPSPESIADLQSSDLVLMCGQIVGGGKSTFIQDLEAGGRVNIPSWTNRDLRPGETDGIDKVHASLGVMAQKAASGYFLELEEVRPGVFYATPAAFSEGQGYVKDLELKGAARLKSFAPDLPIIVPLPPLDMVTTKRVTEWERRVCVREGFDKALSDKAIADLEGRLAGVVEETSRIIEAELVEDPRTLLVINDDLPAALETMNHFLATGEKATQTDVITKHLESLRRIASTALGAVSSATLERYSALRVE